VYLERRSLTKNGPEITPLGLGCFGMSNAYGLADPTEAISTIQHAIDLGCNFLDTADIYGAGGNEQLVGKAIHGRREQVVLATKFGFVINDEGKVIGRNGHPAYVHSAIEASLKRLEVEAVDIYYLHRIDPEIPIEETIGAMAQLVTQGKVRHLGLSEASVEQIRRAHSVHSISVLQSEYSLWSREPEEEILPLCRDLGIGFVAFSPLGRGIFSGKLGEQELQPGDFRRSLPRFEQSNLARNLEYAHRLEEFANRLHYSSSQVALAWILHKGSNVAAIPGTRRQKHLEENLQALTLRLTDAEMLELDTIFSPELFLGQRYSQDSFFKPE
jgi:aryl-alcohol dehydrogenase-like predicted oxidoreductase